MDFFGKKTRPKRSQKEIRAIEEKKRVARIVETV